MKQPVLLTLLVCLILTSVAAQSGRTVTVKLTSGKSIQCRWLKASEQTLELRCDQGLRTIPLDQIAAIEFLSDTKDERVSLAGLSAKQVAIVKTAILALRKMNDTAAFGGISLNQYQTRLAESKLSLDDAKMLLNDGPLRRQIMECWALYLEAGIAWERLQEPSVVPQSQEMLEQLKSRHPHYKPEYPGLLQRDEWVHACWSEAKEMLQPLIELAK